VVNISEFAPRVECFDVVVKLVSFCTVFYAFSKVVVGLFLVEVEEVDTMFLEVYEFTDSIFYCSLWVIM